VKGWSEGGHVPSLSLLQYIDVQVLVFAAFVTTSSWTVSVVFGFDNTGFSLMLPNTKKQQNKLIT
tara:strand:- start:535 stop:729 length:195 start_codon:yes stop_codon:yes gene_type:complete